MVTYVKEDRVIVDVKQIVELFEGQCSEVGCSSMRKVVEKKLEAGVLLITHKCSKGHSGIWSSLSVLGEKRGQKIYVSSVLLASSVLVSGNNFEKVSLLAKGMNLHFVSSTTFARIQSLYAVPSIRELWNKMKEVIWKVFENDVLVVCGDGRMDSPGFSAKYCVYTMMEHYLNVIIDLEVIDKREAGGTSTLMEKMGCKRLLERMMDSLNLGEIVTDASRVIMKMVRELKGKIIQNYHLTILLYKHSACMCILGFLFLLTAYLNSMYLFPVSTKYGKKQPRTESWHNTKLKFIIVTVVLALSIFKDFLTLNVSVLSNAGPLKGEGG